MSLYCRMGVQFVGVLLVLVEEFRLLHYIRMASAESELERCQLILANLHRSQPVNISFGLKWDLGGFRYHMNGTAVET